MKKPKLSVIERYLLPNPMWQEGYASFNKLFGGPLGWVSIVEDDGGNHLVRLDRKSHCSFYAQSASNRQGCELFLGKHSNVMIQDEASANRLPLCSRCSFGKNCLTFPMRHLSKMRGFLVFCAMRKHEKDIQELRDAFEQFISTHVELAYKSFEMNNFYETVHPRALALSTMHSVHRVISSSLRLSELLPRIGRLSAQVLKAKGCSIMLCDIGREYLLPYFSFGTKSEFVHKHRLRIGHGLEGHMAKTGDFHLSRRSIGVPFIEDDIVGIIILWDKADRKPFSKIDLEILKSLSEQAVVAIKNAKLYEETEQLTLGSIKTINELLNLTFGGDRTRLPVFGELVLEVGKLLELSAKELTNLERAILLLDTGALAMPDRVWRKKGKLTKKEFEVVKRIPMQGANLLRSISSLKPIVPTIRYHRERYDGKGYPEGLSGEQIPIGARIVAVVDAFMAMISKRTYRESMVFEQALSEIQAHRGTQFDPQVVDSFFVVVRRKEFAEKLIRLQRSHKQVKAAASLFEI